MSSLQDRKAVVAPLLLVVRLPLLLVDRQNTCYVFHNPINSMPDTLNHLEMFF